MNTDNTIPHGGAYIAHGAFGCVFKPHLKCQDKKIVHKNSIGKTFTLEDEFNDEVSITKIITKKIDPTGNFTVPIITTCDTQGIRRSDKIEECPYYSPERQSYKQIIYKYAGKSIHDIMQKKGTINFFLKYLKMLGPILEGMVKFEKHGYVHSDIKPSNILILKDKMYLIDFSLMGMNHDIYKKNRIPILIDNNPYYPPEFKVRFLPKSDDIQKQFQLYYTRFMQNFGSTKRYETIMNSIGIDTRKELRSFFSASPTFQQKDYNEFAKKTDLYSLGMVSLRLFFWSGFYQRTYTRRTSKSIIKEKVLELLKNMLELDPRKRMSNTQCYNMYMEIMKLVECLSKKTKDLKASLPLQAKKTFKSKIQHCIKS